jgi:small subunit ribosomal protein S20
MNKKQRNRKLVAQNKRNKLINRKYSSTIKSLLKLFLIKMGNLKEKTLKNDETSSIMNLMKEKEKILQLSNNIYSIIDKAIKKKVIHKNTAARKKSRIAKILSKI